MKTVMTLEELKALKEDISSEIKKREEMERYNAIQDAVVTLYNLSTYCECIRLNDNLQVPTATIARIISKLI